MQNQDKRMIALLGDMIDPNFREKLISPPTIEVNKDSEKMPSRPVYKKGPLVPSYSTHRPKLIRFSTMQQLEVMKERCNDKLIVLLLWAKWYPESEGIRIKMENLATNMSHLIMGWCDVDLDKDILSYYEIKTVPYILLIHVSFQFIDPSEAQQRLVRSYKAS